MALMKNGAPFAGRAIFICDSEREMFVAGSHPSRDAKSAQKKSRRFAGQTIRRSTYRSVRPIETV
ncbi:hypothetical protein [Paraburkholderia kirstenboschensis]|uniref:Uncharacterized protein n=1 Tax=Paraburkholderia kirstenboschensis TaxID=1245436 RepID=A0ABZ0ESF4_9BURK|nr:hypothetical protein [Paraburkholderia kirstenboschensis]WOD19536.1 hypothetical protein RW095_25215 [Paraburkholderia kirstenboschensis]